MQQTAHFIFVPKLRTSAAVILLPSVFRVLRLTEHRVRQATVPSARTVYTTVVSSFGAHVFVFGAHVFVFGAHVFVFASCPILIYNFTAQCLVNLRTDVIVV
jgi:hypothetical protein